MPPTKERPASVESHQNVHRSVRVFAFAVAPIREEQLDAMFDKGESPNDFPLVEIILVKKSDSGLVTTLGGEIAPKEDKLHACMRHTFDKSLLTRESQTDFIDSVGNSSPVPYIVTRDGAHRQAFLEVMHVRSGSVSLHEPRVFNGEADKIEQLVSVSPKELYGLFKTGSVTTRHGEQFHIYGHLTEAQSGDVSVTLRAKSIQKKEFERVLDDIYVYEQTIRAQMCEHINRVRRWYHKPLISSLGECGKEEIKRAFLVAQMTLGFTDERLRDAARANMPPPPADLPTASLFLREIAPRQLPDALISPPTKEVRRVRNILHYGLRGTVGELYDRMSRDISEFKTTRGIDSIAALYAIWPDVVALRPDKLSELLSYLDSRFTVHMLECLKIPAEVFGRALRKPERLPKYLARELKHTPERFQLDHPTNEAAGATKRPFVQILHLLGLHPYIPVTPEFNNEAVKRMRGEILMQNAVVFSAIPAIERNAKADNSIFEIGVARFLEYPPELDELVLERAPHTILSRSTKDPVGGRKLRLWYDERPPKDVERLIIKSFQEADIHDDFSVNFVIRDNNFSLSERDDIPVRVAMVDKLRNALVGHFEKELAGSGCKVDIIPGTRKRGTLDAVQTYMNIQSPEERERFADERSGGKRPGSVGNLIVREKFVIRFTKDDRVQFCEVSMYPFEQIEGTDSPLAGSGFIGYKEKISDDMEGRYAAERLINPPTEDPTAPSLIQLLEPESWSRSRFELIRHLQRSPKKKKH
ncbi:MAG: hypothetical protein NTY06_00005 [Candidatus Gottesmanbacteria bacterium]|nr:hypothetical protein [Candidatus Gottesmanbacteria bacterium]